jgi:flagellar motility protein MotE (MotC chaperone)
MSQNPYANYFKQKRDLAKGVKKKRKNKQNLSLILVSSFLTLFCGFYLYIGDEKAAQLLSKVEIRLMGEVEAADTKQEKTSQTKEKEGEKTAAGIEIKKEGKKKDWSEDEVALFSKLDERKALLDAKESELAKLEEELQKQKVMLEKRLVELEEVRGKISAKLDEKVKVDQQKVESLVSVYSSMKPVQAAKVIEGINEDLAVEVLGKMKNKSAAEILNLMDAEKAKRISEKFAGYREPASK